MFYLVINDVSNNIVGNNYFTIQTFDGPDPYDDSVTVINTFNVEFGDVSGFYTRATLLEAINRSLSESEFLIKLVIEYFFFTTKGTKKI